MRNEADFDIKTVFSDEEFEELGKYSRVTTKTSGVVFEYPDFEVEVSMVGKSAVMFNVTKHGDKLKQALPVSGNWDFGNKTSGIKVSGNHELKLARSSRVDPVVKKGNKTVFCNFTHGEVDGNFRLGKELDNFITYNKNSSQLRFAFSLPGNQGIYGVGESFSRFNKWGTSVVTYSIDNNGHAADGMYKGIPFFLTNGGVGVFVNTYSPVKFDFGAKLINMVQITVPLSSVSFILFLGTPKEVLSQYISLDGKPSLPPDWSFGMWMSRWIGVAYKTVAEVEQTLTKFRDAGIPVDVVALDPQWLADYFPGLQVCEFRWDHNRFKTDNELGDYLKQRKMHLSMWVNPYVNLKGEIVKEAGKHLLKDEKGEIALVPDPDPLLRPPRGMYDFSNRESFDFYKEKIRDLLVRSNADCVMTDFGETVPLTGKDSEGDSWIHIRNKLGDLYQIAAFEGAKAARQDGMIWGRSGSIRSHSLAIQWNGDSNANWEGMRNSLRGSLSYLTSGALFTAFDIPGTGGLISENVQKQDEDQYCRWVELGCLFSHLKIHGSLPEPWFYGKLAVEVFRKYMNLRYTLLPYIWEEASFSVKNSVPLIRTLVVEFPEDLNVREIDDEYMLGSKILVAPILDESNERDIYLPKGEWVEYWSKKSVSGGGWLHVEAATDVIPLYVRKNTKLKMFKELAQNIEDLKKKPVEEVPF